MKERPIRCGREGCDWRGYETDLQDVHGDAGRASISLLMCPACGHDSTHDMTPGEIDAWQHAQAQQKGPA